MKLFEDENVNRRFGRMQWRMLFATMIGYTLFYFMRKNFSFAMPGLQQDCGISKSMLGNFLFWGGIVYGLSKFLNGVIGDKVNPKKMLCLGLLACTLVNVAFGFAPQIAARFRRFFHTEAGKFDKLYSQTKRETKRNRSKQKEKRQ